MCQHLFANLLVERCQHEFLLRMYDVGAFPINDEEIRLVLESFLVLIVNFADVFHEFVS